MSHRSGIGTLHRVHVWFVIVGSAAAVAFLASVFAATPQAEPSYAFERVDGARCLVEEVSETVVVREDGVPECEPVAVPRVQVACR